MIIDDGAFRLSVIVLLVVIAFILVVAFFGAIYTAVKAQQLKSAVQGAISNVMTNVPVVSQQLQETANRVGDFIKSVPGLLQGQISQIR